MSSIVMTPAVPPVLVHDDDHLVVTELHLGEQRNDVLGVGDEVGGAGVPGNGVVRAALIEDGG